MRKIIFIFILFMFCSCSFNDFDDPADSQIPTPVPNVTIATLRTLYQGQATTVEWGKPIVIAGVVTTSDEANNFFRSFTIEDASGAIEVKAGLYDLHTIYRLGQSVTIVANGLTLGVERGVLQLGLKGEQSGYETEYMGHRYIVDNYVIRGDVNTPGVGTKILIPQIDDTYMGRLVTIDNLKLDLSPSLSQDTTWAISERLSINGVSKSVSLKFRSTYGDSIYINSSGYSSFAASNVPLIPVAVTGIISQGKIGSRVVNQLKIRDLYDVNKY